MEYMVVVYYFVCLLVWFYIDIDVINASFYLRFVKYMHQFMCLSVDMFTIYFYYIYISVSL